MFNGSTQRLDLGLRSETCTFLFTPLWTSPLQICNEGADYRRWPMPFPAPALTFLSRSQRTEPLTENGGRLLRVNLCSGFRTEDEKAKSGTQNLGRVAELVDAPVLETGV